VLSPPGYRVHDQQLTFVQDRGTPFSDTFAALDKLHKAGKFVRLGISNFTAFEVAEVVTMCKYQNWVRPTIYQGMYNAITRNIDPELVTACRRYGLDIVIYNPLAGGIFSGKYKTSEIPETGRFGNDGGPIGQRYRDRYFKDATFDALRVIEPVVAKHNLSLIETAFRWCVHHSALKIKDGNDGIIIGVSSKKQLEDNLEHIEKGPLPDEVVAALDEAWLIAKATAPDYWHLKLEYTYDTRQALFG
jgi:aflatoxin B1 aldehyde reductase